MSLYKQIGVAALVALLVSLAAVYFVKPKVVERIVENVGAFPGTDFLVDTLNFNGIQKTFKVQRLVTASSTVCSLVPPRTGTSTLVAFDMHIHNATGTALVLEVGKATRGNGNATSTRLIRSGNDTTGVFALGAQSHNTIRFSETDFATSTADAPTTVLDTAAVLNTDFLFISTDRLNVKVGGAVGDLDTGSAVPYRNYAPVGTCSAEWKTI